MPAPRPRFRPEAASVEPKEQEHGWQRQQGILVGNLGRDPEVRFTRNEQKIVTLSVATSERWKDRHSGEPRERTEWHRVVIHAEGLAEIAERYLTTGSTVYLEGQLQTRRWTDQTGQERYTTEIVLQAWRGRLVLLGGSRNGSMNPGSDDGHAAPAGHGEQADPDIPF